jgi:hypothetical protein
VPHFVPHDQQIAPRRTPRGHPDRRRCPDLRPYVAELGAILARQASSATCAGTVILHCPARSFLGARVGLDRERLRAIAPGCPPPQIDAWHDALVLTAEGRDQEGRLAELSQPERFGLLTAPSSTLTQASPVHTGITGSPPGRSWTTYSGGWSAEAKVLVR